MRFGKDERVNRTNKPDDICSIPFENSRKKRLSYMAEDLFNYLNGGLI